MSVIQFAKLIFRPQKVQYSSPNKMYISQQFSGSDPPGHPLLVFSIRNRNKRLVNNQCTSLNEVKL